VPRKPARAADWIRSIADDDRPFLLVYSCNEPHHPFVYPDPFVGMYRAEQAELPLTLDDPAGPESLTRRYRATLVPASRYSEEQIRAMSAAYHGGVSFVDHCAGLIFTALLETDQYDRTLIIYTSDHGELLGNHGLFFKGSHMHDDMVRVPLVVRPPGGLAGGRPCDALVSHVDLVPTIAHWCGARTTGLHGQMIGELMQGADGAVRDGVSCEYHSGLWQVPISPLRMWRTPEWKYVESRGGDHELYDLRSDPNELRNLLADAASATALGQMRHALGQWLASVGDPWPEVPVPPPRPPAA